jgi:hypothetical protein
MPLHEIDFISSCSEDYISESDIYLHINNDKGNSYEKLLSLIDRNKKIIIDNLVHSLSHSIFDIRNYNSEMLKKIYKDVLLTQDPFNIISYTPWISNNKK